MKKMKVLVVMLLVVAFAAYGLVGCAPSNPATESATGAASEAATQEATQAASEAAAPADGEKLTIGYSVYWLSEFATLMTEAMQEKADAAGVELLVRDAKWDPVVQLGHVDEFITKGVDAMIIAPCDAASMVQGVEAAKEAGIPYIGVNMRVDAEIDAYAGPDDVKAGEMMFQYVADQLGDSFNCIILEGAEGYYAMLDRRQGLENMLEKYPNVKALAIKTAGWTRDGALELMENYIQDYGDQIDAVICHNDEMALGAIQALEAVGMNDKVIVTGIDAIKDACQAIKDGRQEYTVFQDAELEGGLAFDKALALAKGQTLDEKETYIDMIGVTKDNVQPYLDAFNK
jgi:ABC-type sugar transport system substrate-binding protein